MHSVVLNLSWVAVLGSTEVLVERGLRSIVDRWLNLCVDWLLAHFAERCLHVEVWVDEGI